MTPRHTALLPDGRTVETLTLAHEDIVVTVSTLGAAIDDLKILRDGVPRPVVIGVMRPEDRLAHIAHCGAIAGRVANRIREGHFTLDGRAIQLARNEKGRNHLHGGAIGFARRIWEIEEAALQAVTLRHVSPDGEDGYPGTLTARCRYEVDKGVLRILLTATTEAPTLVNLATHSYFDLDRGETILDHFLTIPAESYTPVDDSLIPTGEITPVAGTPFDFRSRKRVAEGGGGLDHNFVLGPQPFATPRLAARLEGARSGITLEIHSTEPGLQVYDCKKLALPVPLRDGRMAGAHAAICLEPQRFPDAVHHPHFPSILLRPGEIYRQVTEYRLS